MHNTHIIEGKKSTNKYITMEDRKRRREDEEKINAQIWEEARTWEEEEKTERIAAGGRKEIKKRLEANTKNSYTRHKKNIQKNSQTRKNNEHNNKENNKQIHGNTRNNNKKTYHKCADEGNKPFI